MVMLWEPVHRGQAESRACLPTPTCSGAPARFPQRRGCAAPTPFLTAKDNVTDGKSLAPRKFGCLQGSHRRRDWVPGTRSDAPALTSLASSWVSWRGPLHCWTQRSLLHSALAQVFLLFFPLAVTFWLGRKDKADVAYRDDALTADPMGSGLSRAGDSDGVALLMASSSKIAHMAQTGGININSIQISIETELEMEDPMQLKPSSSFPHAAIPSIIPEHFIKPVELGRVRQK